MTENIPAPAPSPRRDVFTPAYHILVLLLLLGILGAVVFGLFYQSLPSFECKAAIERANLVVENQIAILDDQRSEYSYAVYDNPDVETIYQQTFLANEYQFYALNLIAMQNSVLLDVTTNCR